MKGFVPTPSETVDAMVELLFRERRPGPRDRVLDPGCGTGAFIEGIIRWCAKHDLAVPRVTGVESDPRHVAVLRDKFAGHPAVEIRHADYLLSGPGEYEFIVGNPPYVAITGLSQADAPEPISAQSRTLLAGNMVTLDVNDWKTITVEGNIYSCPRGAVGDMSSWLGGVIIPRDMCTSTRMASSW